MQTWLFLGDSITDAGRLWLPDDPADDSTSVPNAPVPVSHLRSKGETQAAPSCAAGFHMGDSPVDSPFYVPGLGNGYVAMLHRYLEQRYPRTITVINKGHDGFTVPALLRNIHPDCLACNPDFVSILIGINDVGVARNTGVSLQKQRFEENYRRVLETIRTNTHAALLCIGPFVFARPQSYQLWMDCVREAEAIIASLADQYHIPFLPMHDRLNIAAREQSYQAITTDGIHLTENGHRILAEEIIKYLPFSNRVC